MNKTKIEWCNQTWNPVTGCLHNCPYCYARKIAQRFGRKDILKTPFNMKYPVYDDDRNTISYPFGFTPVFHRYRLLDEPQKHKKPQNIFVCSMADLFGEWVPDDWIREVFAACEKAPQHRYLFLTKNPKKYIELAKKGMFPRQHWYGYTATTDSDLWKFHHADECPCINLFISIEPIQDEFVLPLSTHCPADWIIVGAETGNRKGKIVPKREWIERIVRSCRASGVPIFLKNSLADIWQEPLIQEYPW